MNRLRHPKRLSFEQLEDRRVLAGGALADSPTESEAADETSLTPARERFATEADLQDFMVQQALKQYSGMFGQKGWPSQWWYRNGFDTGLDITTDVGPVPAYSQTNNQVSGVEEGDIAETDGQYIYLADDRGVTVIDARRPGHLSVASRFPIDGYVSALYLEGGRLTVLSQQWGFCLEPMAVDMLLPYEPAEPELRISVIDVTSPASPQKSLDPT